MACTGGELGISWIGGSTLLPTRTSSSRYQQVSSTDIYGDVVNGPSNVRLGKLSIFTDGPATYATCRETRYIDPRKNRVITECALKGDGIGEATLAAEWYPDPAFISDIDVPLSTSDLTKYLNITFTEPYYRPLQNSSTAPVGSSLGFNLPVVVGSDSPYGQFLISYGFGPGEILAHSLPLAPNIPLYYPKLVCLDYLNTFPLTVDWVNFVNTIPNPTRPSLVWSLGTDMARLLPTRPANVYETTVTRGSVSELHYRAAFNGGRSAIPGQLFNKGYIAVQGRIYLYSTPCG
jgi:hypothetical protein